MKESKMKEVKLKELKLKFWCNSGWSEEEVTVEIYENWEKTEEEQIEEEFHKWLDNNQDCGWEIL